MSINDDLSKKGVDRDYELKKKRDELKKVKETKDSNRKELIKLKQATE